MIQRKPLLYLSARAFSIARISMFSGFSHPPETDSTLRHLDPRWKTVTLLTAALLVPFLRSLPTATMAWMLAFALVLIGRLPVRWYLSRLSGIAAFLALVVCVIPFSAGHEDPLWQWGPLSISTSGIYLACLVLIKALAIVTLVAVLFATTPLHELFPAARSLHVPALLVHLVLLTERYAMLIAEELFRVRIALRVRGYRNRMSRHSYQTAGNVAGALLVRGQERAERVSQAMRCRGFDGSFRCLHSFTTRPRDVLLSVLILGSYVSLLGYEALRL
jgi:cobalt/nickel transport system permease protein